MAAISRNEVEEKAYQVVSMAPGLDDEIATAKVAKMGIGRPG